MKRRLSAILLAAGLCVSALSIGVYAADTETELLTEAVSEAAAEASEAQEADVNEQANAYLTNILTTVAAWSEEEINTISAGDDPSSASIAATWASVKGELGNFVELTSCELSEDGMSIIGHAKYENPDESTDVIVTYTIDQKSGSFKVEWEMIETLGTKMKKAGLNTLMGIGIVFLALLFLSVLIGKLHIIPDMIEGKTKKAAPSPAPAPAAAPAPAPVMTEEEDLTDDLELVAVITAAIAASENTSGDGFVVRSIKKSNKRNWQKA